MRNVIQAIDERTAIFREQPIFAFLRDRSIEPRRRLAFAPSVAHYVMTFGDLCGLVLFEEPAKDWLQEIVNAQTREEAEHRRWFLKDLAKLGFDETARYTDVLSFLWSDETVRSRMLSYKICRLALGADSLRKLVVVYCAEATAEVTIKHVLAVASEWSETTGQKLAFFGGAHDEAEEDHTLWEAGTMERLRNLELEPEVEKELIGMVHVAFDAFTELTEEMLDTARSQRALASQ